MTSVTTSPGAPAALVGRDEAIQALRAVLERAHLGRSAGIVVSGPPGVGKSALLARFRAEATDCTVLASRGIETESEWAYAGLHQLLNSILHLADKIPSAHREAIEIALRQAPGAAEPMMVGMGVLGLLAEAAEERAVLCILDDVQWLDQASKLALQFAIRRLSAEPVAVAMAQRRGGLADPGWLEELEEIELAPLDLALESELLATLVGERVPADVAARIHEVTGGLPLATKELARALTAGQLSGREPLPARLPITTSLHRVFDRSLHRLPSDSRRLLLLAAADDSGAAGPVLSAGRTLGLTGTALDELERSDLLRRKGGDLEFRHPLIRSVMYDSASAEDRRSAHQALSKAYAAAGDDARRAWHNALAVTPPNQKAADDLWATAGHAEERNAHAEASAQYELASTLCESRHRQAEMLVEAALCSWRVGELDRALSLADRARPLAQDPVVLGRLEYIRGGILLGRGQPASAFELLLSAGDRLVEVRTDEAIRAWTLASEAVSFEGSRASAATLASVVAAKAPSQIDPADGFKVKMIVGLGRFFQGELGPALDSMKQAMDEAIHLSTAADLASAARVAFYVGDDEAFLAWNTRAMERARTSGSIGQLPVIGGRSGLIELLLGRFDLALASADESIRLAADTGQPQLGARGLCWSALVKAHRGDSEGCRELVERALEGAAGTIASMTDAAAWALGSMELSKGNLAAARKHLGSIDDLGYRVLAGLDSIEAFEGDQSRLSEEVSLASSYAAASGAPWALARAAHGRALLSSGGESEEAFAESLQHHERSQRLFERARTQLAFGAWLRRHRRRKEARGQLEAALEVFDRLSATPWAERAQSELRASGGTLSRRGERSFFDLTPQEFQVARLVGEGMSNRDAASHLYLSPRTVDHHLRNVFVKLGISSRTELMRLHLENGPTG